MTKILTIVLTLASITFSPLKAHAEDVFYVAIRALFANQTNPPASAQYLLGSGEWEDMPLDEWTVILTHTNYPQPTLITFDVQHAMRIALETNKYVAFEYKHWGTHDHVDFLTLTNFDFQPRGVALDSEIGVSLQIERGTDGSEVIYPPGEHHYIVPTQGHLYWYEWIKELTPPNQRGEDYDPCWPCDIQESVKDTLGFPELGPAIPENWTFALYPDVDFSAAVGTSLGSYGSATPMNSGATGEGEFENTLSGSIGFARGIFQTATNVTGYQLMTFPPGKTAFSFPWIRGVETVDELFDGVPTGCGIMLQVGTSLAFVTNVWNGSAWSDPAMKLTPGKGFIFNNTSGNTYSNLFYGFAGKGTFARTWSSGTYHFAANPLPKAGYIVDLGFDNDEDDAVSLHLWNGSAWEESTWDEENGWTSLASFTVDEDKGPWLNVGQPVVIERHGSADPSWSGSFTP